MLITIITVNKSLTILIRMHLRRTPWRFVKLPLKTSVMSTRKKLQGKRKQFELVTRKQTWNTVTMAQSRESKFFRSGIVSPLSVRKLNLQPNRCIPRMLQGIRNNQNMMWTVNNLKAFIVYSAGIPEGEDEEHQQHAECGHIIHGLHQHYQLSPQGGQEPDQLQHPQ